MDINKSFVYMDINKSFVYYNQWNEQISPSQIL